MWQQINQLFQVVHGIGDVQRPALYADLGQDLARQPQPCGLTRGRQGSGCRAGDLWPAWLQTQAGSHVEERSLAYRVDGRVSGPDEGVRPLPQPQSQVTQFLSTDCAQVAKPGAAPGQQQQVRVVQERDALR
jgi:hypothetical protein